MKEQLITFDTAKLAKEKGFNGLSQMRYNEDGVLTGTKLGMHNKPNSYVGSFASPTQSLLQKWLRDTHNIDVDIWCNASGWAFNLNKTNGTTIYSYDYYFGNIDSGMFNSYEEALEQGLQEALKLIKI